MGPVQTGGVDTPARVRIEDYYLPSDAHLSYIGRVYDYFYRFRNQRSGNMRQLQYQSFDEFWRISRELFWNSSMTQSEDLQKLGLQFSLPFIRKEVMDFQGRMISLNLKPKITGEGLGQYGAAVLNGIYKKWRMKNKDEVEKFWELLYAQVNGTLSTFISFDAKETTRRYITKFNPSDNTYDIDKKVVKMWNDVTSTIVPIEEIYLAKLWERNIQKQGKVIRLQEMSWAEFQTSLAVIYPEAKYVIPGWRIAEDSLYFRLLGGSGVTTADKVQVVHLFDTDNGEYYIMANGIWLNFLGDRENPTPAPMPFNHGLQPFTWVINEPIDEKFAYGLSLPFKEKDPHKLLNTFLTIATEREIRAGDPPFLTSDFEAPKLIYGAKKVIPVNDINAYKELEVQEIGESYYTLMNTIQGIMTDQSQGGNTGMVDSRQPKSAREVMQINQAKQQAMSNAQLMYYDLVYQEFNLVVRTALQFYQSGKFEENNLVKALLVPNSPLSNGGVGNVDIRIVKKTKDPLELHFEAILKSIENGKNTEIIEVPVSALNDLDFYIDDIALEPDQGSDIERANYYERVFTPMMQFFVPSGIADMGKLFLRFTEKMGEHPADYTSNQTLSKLMGSWSTPSPFQFFAQQGQQQQQGGAPQPGQQPQQGQPGQPQTGPQTGNMALAQPAGQRFGSKSAGGYPSDVPYSSL